MSGNHSGRSGGIIGISFQFFGMTGFCVFFLESPHGGDSNEYTQYIIINIKRKSTEIISNTILSAAMGFFVKAQE